MRISIEINLKQLILGWSLIHKFKNLKAENELRHKKRIESGLDTTSSSSASGSTVNHISTASSSSSSLSATLQSLVPNSSHHHGHHHHHSSSHHSHGQNSGGGGGGSGSSSSSSAAADRKRKRTSIAAPEKRSLEMYFNLQPRPSGEKIAQIAEKLDLKKNVVRVWFCNQRQKQKRMKFAAIQTR